MSLLPKAISCMWFTHCRQGWLLNLQKKKKSFLWILKRHIVRVRIPQSTAWTVWAAAGNSSGLSVVMYTRQRGQNLKFGQEVAERSAVRRGTGRMGNPRYFPASGQVPWMWQAFFAYCSQTCTSFHSLFHTCLHMDFSFIPTLAD